MDLRDVDERVWPKFIKLRTETSGTPFWTW